MREAIPRRLTEYIAAHLSIPTIGISAGPARACDDALTREKAKSVRRFADVGDEEGRGMLNYGSAVRDGSEDYEIAGSDRVAFCRSDRGQCV
jgi:3-methyl-2-oxobutanoate hydroxymethyltransferase